MVITPPRLHFSQPALAAIAMGFVLAALASIGLWHLRGMIVTGQSRELTVLSLALSDEVGRSLQGAEVGMRAIRLDLREGHLPTAGLPATRALRIRAEIMPFVQTLWLVNSKGDVLAGSDNTPPPPLSTFSPALNALTEGAIAISRPFPDSQGQESLVAIGIQLGEAPGVANGNILAAIPAQALRGAFDKASQATDVRLALFRDDGARLSGSIVETPTLDETGRAARLVNASPMEVRRFRDGKERIVSLQSLPRYGLKLMLTHDLDAVLATWRGVARMTAIGLALLFAVVMIAVYLVHRANQKQVESKNALQAMQSRESRLESLGTLAGGVAHDFNNVLAAILGYSEMAYDAAPKGSDQARHLDNVLQATLRGKTLVERILTFSRGGARESTVFKLESIVEEVLTLLAASLPPGIVVERESTAEDGLVRGDSTQIFEAVMNLCTNALQAMPDGGMLSIQLSSEHTEAPRMLSHAQLVAGRYLALSISDQGAGITPDVMDRLFEPFFTTRAGQSGTGLGLAVVHGVMAEIGGAIDVQSAPGHGARFTLYMPECSDTVATKANSIKADLSGTGQTILVVDDEPALVTLMTEWLGSLGYVPVGFTDPLAAQRVLRDTPRRFAAVISDEVMPGLTGTQLARDLRRYAPNLPVLLISGYGGVALASRAAAAGATRVLTKPLKRAELARALKEMLG